jgi:hypothetical protein
MGATVCTAAFEMMATCARYLVIARQPHVLEHLAAELDLGRIEACNAGDWRYWLAVDGLGPQ